MGNPVLSNTDGNNTNENSEIDSTRITQNNCARPQSRADVETMNYDKERAEKDAGEKHNYVELMQKVSIVPLQSRSEIQVTKKPHQS